MPICLGSECKLTLYADDSVILFSHHKDPRIISQKGVNILKINENATLVFSISFQHGLVHQNFVFIRQLYVTYSIKRSFFVLID